MRLIKTLIAGLVGAALIVAPAVGLAKGRDRDHDRMPDKWERAHHLNPRVNDAAKDPDKDGLSNLSEFRHGTNPRRADTDEDGVNDRTELRDGTNPRHDDAGDDNGNDANEVRGTVVSFDSGVLTLQPATDGAATVSGTVNDATRIDCDAADATASSHGGDDGGSDDDHSGPGSGSGETEPGDDNSGPGSANSGRSSDDNSGQGSSNSGSDDGTGHDAGDDNGDDQKNDNACTTAKLVPGAVVREAKTVTADDGSTVFTKIEL